MRSIECETYSLIEFHLDPGEMAFLKRLLAKAWPPPHPCHLEAGRTTNRIRPRRPGRLVSSTEVERLKPSMSSN